MLHCGDNGLLSQTSDVRDDANSNYVDSTLDLAYISVDAEYVTQNTDNNRLKYYSEGGQGKNNLKSYLADKDIEVVGYEDPTSDDLKIKLDLSYKGNTYNKELDIVDPALNDINIAAYASDIASRGFTINTAIGSALDVTRISYSIDRGQTFTDTTEDSHTFTGLTPDTTYYVRVTAENEAGDTSETGIIEVTTLSDSGSASGSSTRYLYNRYQSNVTYNTKSTSGTFGASSDSWSSDPGLIDYGQNVRHYCYSESYSISGGKFYGSGVSETPFEGGYYFGSSTRTYGGSISSTVIYEIDSYYDESSSSGVINRVQYYVTGRRLELTQNIGKKRYCNSSIFNWRSIN